MEDIDKILDFMSAFVEGLATPKKKGNDARRFAELSEEDQDNINDLLQQFGIQFPKRSF